MWKLHSYHFFICVYLFWFSEIKFCNHSSSSTIMCSLSTEPRCTVSTIVLKNSVFFDKCFSMWAMYHTFQWMYFCNCILPLCNVFESYLILSLALASNMIKKASFFLLSALLICCGAEDTGMQPHQLQINTNTWHFIDN